MSDAPPAVQIAHVLFLDVVGYSRESTTAQGHMIERLNAAVTGTAAYAEATARGTVQPLPTGDGMALLFFGEVTAPARCAAELSRALRRAEPPLPVRMGIHSGLVQRQVDIAGRHNMVGEGINTAQRAMSFGDAGHILLTDQYASWLQNLDPWVPFVEKLGQTVAKHDQPITLWNLRSSDFGRSDPPAALSSGAAIPRPAAVPGAIPRKVVLLYRRNARPDEDVLHVVEERLKAAGHEVFVDRHLKIGIEWAQAIEGHIRAADAVVAIVSPRSLQSEMLEYEIETAHDQYQKSGRPVILPIRVGPDDPGDGPIHAIIGSLNYFRWNGPADDPRLAAELLSAIREPPRPRSVELRLEPVGGAVPPDSPFYIERAADSEFGAALAARETILLIKGPRQIGKTSLQARGVKQAREQGWRCGLTDFQKLNTAQIASEEVFYRLLAATLGRQLKFSYDFESEWMDLFGANLNMETFLRELLDASDQPLVWFMDEVDKLFTAPFASDFFGLVRSWHNSRSTEPGGPWDKLTVVIAYATEAHLFIQDLNQSPFNVGRRLDLADFTLPQIMDLNSRYGSPLGSEAEADEVHALIGGQPFLTRQALDTLATGKLDFARLLARADRDDGPFGDHLKRILVAVSRLPEVASYCRGLLSGSTGTDQETYYRLLAAGIVRQDLTGTVSFRCELYRRYLSNHLL